MDNDYFNNIQKWGRIFQDYEAEVNKLQDMLKEYYHYNDNLNRLHASMSYGEPEHFELIRNSQTMTDQTRKHLPSSVLMQSLNLVKLLV